MSKRLAKILSQDCGAFWQLVKYGLVGLLATAIQTAAFYLLAVTSLKCLAAGDWAVRLLGLPAVELSHAERSWRFAAATAIGFLLANVFCWVMNRLFVFRSGRYRWFKELVLFISVSAVAMVVATATSVLLIRYAGLMTSAAVVVEVVVSFLFNYFVRKFLIFRG